MPAARIAVTDEHEDARRAPAGLAPGDRVLVKGSRGAAMERCVAHLRREPARGPSLMLYLLLYPLAS